MYDKKTALITGITGQDGTYLAELLLAKGYSVHGIMRRSSSSNVSRLEHLLTPNHENQVNLHFSDLTDETSLFRLMNEIQPDEVYNLAAQSHVHTSFENPQYTANVDGLGPLRLLEAIRVNGLAGKTKFYQASTSELYGKIQSPVQDENTPFYPRSPYGVAKQYAYWITVNYRESYDMFACSGILFNHESPIRGETFVTRKITQAIAQIKGGTQECLFLGNLDAKRDWGHAKDYVEGMWRMLQAEVAEEYVLATKCTTTVRDFLLMSFEAAGLPIEFNGSGLDEVAFCKETGRVVVRISPEFFRPAEVDILLGDPAKAKEKLGWEPQATLKALCQEMVLADNLRYRKMKGETNIRTPEDIVKECGGYSNWYSYALEHNIV